MHTLTFQPYEQGLGNTALHYASQKGYGDVVRALIGNHCTLLTYHLRAHPPPHQPVHTNKK